METCDLLELWDFAKALLPSGNSAANAPSFITELKSNLLFANKMLRMLVVGIFSKNNYQNLWNECYFRKVFMRFGFDFFVRFILVLCVFSHRFWDYTMALQLVYMAKRHFSKHTSFLSNAIRVMRVEALSNYPPVYKRWNDKDGAEGKTLIFQEKQQTWINY